MNSLSRLDTVDILPVSASMAKNCCDLESRSDVMRYLRFFCGGTTDTVTTGDSAPSGPAASSKTEAS